MNDILKSIESDLQNGAKEIWITSQDTGCYGLDIPEAGINICGLLEKICSLEGDFMVRLGMANPNHILPILDKLIYSLKHPKMFKFLHIPVQSGDDKILTNMLRTYSVADLKKIVKGFRKEIPLINISTDVIVGLPGETVESFEETVDLIKEVEPGVLNVSRYFTREGTKAYSMKAMHPKHSKELSRILDRMYKKLAVEINSKLIGKKTDVLFTGIGTDKNQYRGRNICYKPIVVSSKQNILGLVKTVKIEKASKDHLLGKAI